VVTASRGKNPVAQLRALPKGRVEGRVALARDAGHLLAAVYIACIVVTAWVIGVPH
jgi:hypothetical protein